MRDIEESEIGPSQTLVLELQLKGASGSIRKLAYITILQELAHFLSEKEQVRDWTITISSLPDGFDPIGGIHSLNGSL